MTDLMIRDVRPHGGAAVDVLVHDDAIIRIAPGLKAPAGATVLDGQNALLLPGLIEGHGHLDKTRWGLPWRRNAIGPTGDERIAHEREYRRDGAHDAEGGSLRLARAYLANGTTRMRSHADIDT